jgi:Sigma-70, region 4/Helix-turn-helix domain
MVIDFVSRSRWANGLVGSDCGQRRRDVEMAQSRRAATRVVVMLLSEILELGPKAETRYGDAVDVNRATDLYAQGRTLRQIGAELGVTATTVSHHLRRAGVTMRRGGASAHPASTQQIFELRDQGLTWPEIAEQVGMTVSGAWSRYQRARPPKFPRLGRWQQVLAEALDENLAFGVRAAVADHLGRAPTRAEVNAARRAAHSLAASNHAACSTCRVRIRTTTQATATTWCWRSRM